MDKTELKHIIALLLEDAKRLQQVEPNAGTEARLGLAQKVLNTVCETSEHCGHVSDKMMSDNKNEMHIRRVKMLQVMPVLDKCISETLEENGIPGAYSLDAVRLLLAVYKATNGVMPLHFENDSDFSVSR